MRATASSFLAGVLLTASLAAAQARPAAAAAPGARRPFIDQPLPEVKFEAVSLKDALEFFRDITQLNMHVDWKALAEAGVTEQTTVSTQVRNVTVRKALSMLLQDAAGAGVLTFYPDGGVLEITSKDAADRRLVTRVYAVDDLIVEVPDFEGRALNFSSSNSGGGGSRNGGGGGGGGSGGLFGDTNGGGGGGANGTGGETVVKTKQERADDLVTLLQSTVEPQIWRENGGVASMRYFRGNLIVTAPRGVHEKLGGR